jgi:predicted ATPase
MTADRVDTCLQEVGECKLIVITGGPGAGKTAVLELARRTLCSKVAVLPEAAGVIFGGGFWRLGSVTARLSAQRAIFHVQKEMEVMAQAERKWTAALCDRGTIDGLAYWPQSEESFWTTFGTTREREYARYAAVIHLRSPSDDHGYNHQNPLRTETAEEAAAIDDRIAKEWKDHPNYVVIPSHEDFFVKAELSLRYILAQLPACCRVHCGHFLKAGARSA